jgi:hypothetical protein
MLSVNRRSRMRGDIERAGPSMEISCSRASALRTLWAC